MVSLVWIGIFSAAGNGNILEVEMGMIKIEKDCIWDFCDAWQTYDLQSAINIANGHWDLRFRDAGYYGVDLSAHGGRGRRELHEWCKEHIGHQHYAWTGTSMFWFETESSAVMFALKWS